MEYSKAGVIEMFRPIVEANDDIQEFISENGESLPDEFLPLLSHLDWVIRHYGEIPSDA